MAVYHFGPHVHSPFLGQQSSPTHRDIALWSFTGSTLPFSPTSSRGHTLRASASRVAELQQLVHNAELPRSLQPPPTSLTSLAAHPFNFPETALEGCEPGAAPLRVALLLSGGVDSSLALRLLQAAGHQVTAFYLQIWFQEDFRNSWDACPWEEDLQMCEQVCQQAGVPLRVVPLTDQYWDRVVAHSIAEIRAGRTPNPDILCNSRVKFGAFHEYLETQCAGEFDRIASGHYARLLRSSSDSSSPVSLALTGDQVKDQTYFLAHLTQQQLARVMFPIGPLVKAEVRQLAAAAGLPNQARKDSQGICFLGKVRFSEFVREHLGEWPGPIVEHETGEVLGYHRGVWFHTPGQRKGVPLHGGPWYVVQKDVDANVVEVSRRYYEGWHRRDAFRCSSFNWIVAGGPDLSRPLQCKVRHGPKLYACHLTFEGLNRESATVVLDGNDQGLAAGQYAAFYQGGICIGSAVMDGALALDDDGADEE